MVEPKNKVAINLNGLIFAMVFSTINVFPEVDGQPFSMSYGQIFTIFSQIGLLTAMLKMDFLLPYSINSYIFFHYFACGFLAGWIEISLIPFFMVGGKNWDSNRHRKILLSKLPEIELGFSN